MEIKSAILNFISHVYIQFKLLTICWIKMSFVELIFDPMWNSQEFIVYADLLFISFCGICTMLVSSVNNFFFNGQMELTPFHSVDLRFA